VLLEEVFGGRDEVRRDNADDHQHAGVVDVFTARHDGHGPCWSPSATGTSGASLAANTALSSGPCRDTHELERQGSRSSLRRLIGLFATEVTDTI
jgi:hypothetical protein